MDYEYLSKTTPWLKKSDTKKADLQLPETDSIRDILGHEFYPWG